LHAARCFQCHFTLNAKHTSHTAHQKISRRASVRHRPSREVL